MTNDPIEIIRSDHREVEDFFKEYAELGETALVRKRAVADRIIRALSIHAEMEEALCYPRFKDAFDAEETTVDEAYIEHEGVKSLIAELAVLEPSDPKFDATMKVLMEQVQHHVEEEEAEMLPKVSEELDEETLESMGDEMMEFKQSQPL